MTTTTWLAYEDMAAGTVVLEVDETSIRVFSSRSAVARAQPVLPAPLA